MNSDSSTHFLTGIDTVPALLARRVALTPNKPAHFTRDDSGAWRPTTWSQLATDIEQVAAGLTELGLAQGERIAILANTSQDWEICQIAAFQIGMTVIGIDPHYPAEQINRILSELRPAALVAGDDSLLQRVDPAMRARLRLVLMTGERAVSDGIVTLARLKHRHGAARTTDRAAPVRGDDPAIIVFSSGTTGVPKPIVYTHAQICMACQAFVEALENIDDGCSLVCWLPLANLFQRVINYCGIIKGAVTYIVTDPRLVMDCVREANPQVFFAVPRFCERLYAGVEDVVAKLPKPIAAVIRGGLAANIRESHLAAAHIPVPLGTRLFALVARHTVLKRLRRIMGRELKYIVSGSAPCPKWLLDTFAALGMPILEAYGQSENIIPIAANVWSARKTGTVGRPLKCNQVRLSAEGVVEVRGPGVFRADLAENRARPALTPDGYLATGDLGEFTADGFLTLTGRQAEVFKTANGRWAAPSDIEAALRRVRYVDQVAVLARDGATILAILVISAPAYTGGGTSGAPGGGDLDLRAPQAQERIRGDVVREVAALAPALWPRGLLLTTRPFSVEGGELTTNFKLRRAAIGRKYESPLGGLIDEIHRSGSTSSGGDQIRIHVL